MTFCFHIQCYRGRCRARIQSYSIVILWAFRFPYPTLSRPFYSTDPIVRHRNVMNVCFHIQCYPGRSTARIQSYSIGILWAFRFPYPTLSRAFLEFISGRSTVRIQSYNIRSVNRWSLILYSSDLNPTASEFWPIVFDVLQYGFIITASYFYPMLFDTLQHWNVMIV